jgi:hypothetical protein
MTNGFLEVNVAVADGSNVLKGAIREHLGQMPGHKQELMEAVGRAIRELGLNAQFSQEGGFFGNFWADTEPRYTAWKIEMFGSPAAAVGTRTGAMREAASNAPGAGVVTRSWSTRKGRQNQVTATPILEATEDSVTVGVDAEQNGRAYAKYFDDMREIFGSELPYDLEVAIGKAIHRLYMVVCRGAGASGTMESTVIDRFISGNVEFFGG